MLREIVKRGNNKRMIDFLIKLLISPGVVVGYIIVLWLITWGYNKKRKNRTKKDFEVDDVLEESSNVYYNIRNKDKVK
jgi:hypothetical protein